MYPPPYCGKPQEEVFRFLAQLSIRYLELSMHMSRNGHYKEARILWGKYSATRTISSALFPYPDDKGNYSFSYLIQKLDCRIDEIKNAHEKGLEFPSRMHVSTHKSRAMQNHTNGSLRKIMRNFFNNFCWQPKEGCREGLSDQCPHLDNTGGTCNHPLNPLNKLKSVVVGTL